MARTLAPAPVAEQRTQPPWGSGLWGTFAGAPPAADRAAQAWAQLGAEDRFVDMQHEFSLYPPRFRMPRATLADWDHLWEGPTHFLMKHKERSKERPWLKDPELESDNFLVRQCRTSMEKKQSFYQNMPIVRRCGCQWLLVALSVATVCWYRHNHGGAELSQILVYVLVIEWVFFYTILTCSWMKGVVQCGNILFYWLACTYEQVDRSGEVLCFHIRQQIFLRVFGLLHCPQMLQKELLDRNQGQPFHKLEGEEADFAEDEVADDGTIMSGCLFVDDSGERKEFVWDYSRDDYDGHTLSRTAVPYVRDLEGDVYDLDEEPFSPWNQRDMSYVFDLQGDEVEAWVNSSVWFQKLEFALQLHQSRLSGYREYLGPRIFSRKGRFITFASVVPLLWVLAIALGHCYYVLSEREISCNATQLVPQFFFATGFGVFTNMIAANASNEWGARACINLVMSILEVQVNRDWDTIMGHDRMDDVQDLYLNADQVNYVDSIPILWQVVSSRENLQNLAVPVWEHIQSRGGLPSWMMPRF